MTKMFLWIFLSMLVVLSACSSTEPAKYNDFALCLSENDVKMYGTEWCSHCQNQKKEFGKSFGYIDFVDCDLNKNACLEAGVQFFPTWVVNGTLYVGEQKFERLAMLSGCELPAEN